MPGKPQIPSVPPSFVRIVCARRLCVFVCRLSTLWVCSHYSYHSQRCVRVSSVRTLVCMGAAHGSFGRYLFMLDLTACICMDFASVVYVTRSSLHSVHSTISKNELKTKRKIIIRNWNWILRNNCILYWHQFTRNSPITIFDYFFSSSIYRRKLYRCAQQCGTNARNRPKQTNSTDQNCIYFNIFRPVPSQTTLLWMLFCTRMTFHQSGQCDTRTFSLCRLACLSLLLLRLLFVQFCRAAIVTVGALLSIRCHSRQCFWKTKSFFE